MAYRFTPADRGEFKCCRRQWDVGARERQNYEPDRPAAAPDLDLAVREALAVYYFPGMWDWQRSVVLPLVLQGWPGRWAASRRPRPTTSWPRARACCGATSSGRPGSTASPPCRSRAASR